MKIALVGSSGGHLKHLILLKKVWVDHSHFWVTFNKEDTKNVLKSESVYYCHFPTNRNFINLFRNMILAIRVLSKEKPDLIISSGAGACIPFFYIGKLLGIKLVFLEVFDRLNSGTLTGKLVYPITDIFIVQWEEMLSVYPKAVYLGGIF